MHTKQLGGYPTVRGIPGGVLVPYLAFTACSVYAYGGDLAAYLYFSTYAAIHLGGFAVSKRVTGPQLVLVNVIRGLAASALAFAVVIHSPQAGLVVIYGEVVAAGFTFRPWLLTAVMLALCTLNLHFAVDLGHPSTSALLAAAGLAALAFGSGIVGRYAGLDKTRTFDRNRLDETLGWTSVSAAPIASGGVVTVTMDISDRKRYEDEIRLLNSDLEKRVEQRSRDLLEAVDLNEKILSASAIGIVAFEAGGRCVFANEAAEKIVGGTREQILKLNFRTMHSLKEHGLLDAALGTLETGMPRAGQFYVTTTFGRTSWIRADLVRFTRAGAQHVLFMLQDIAAQKEAEESIRRAKEAAEAASAAKSRFLSLMSHELRTPLNAVIGFSQVLNDELLHPTQREYVQEIHSAGGHLLSLVADILDLSSIETGQVDIRIRDVTVQHAVRSACETMQVVLDKRRIRIRQQVEPGLVASADANRVRQILTHLISASANQADVGTELTVEARTGGPGLVHVTVSAEEEPGPREKSGRQEQSIGLTLSKLLAKAMNGDLEIVPRTGVGPSYRLVLIQGAAVQTEEKSKPPRTGLLAGKGHVKVLYIEDNEVNAMVVSAMFRHEGSILLLVAKTAAQGVSMAADHQPDVILLDLNLPDASGYDVFKDLRSNAKTAPIPVIAVTADAMPEQVARGIDSGFTHYLTKPFKKVDLFETIAGVLTARH